MDGTLGLRLNKKYDSGIKRTYKLRPRINCIKTSTVPEIFLTHGIDNRSIALEAQLERIKETQYSLIDL